MKKTTCVAKDGPGSIYTGKSGRFENTKCYCTTCNVTEARQTLEAARAAQAPRIGAEPRTYKRPAAKAYRPVKYLENDVRLCYVLTALKEYCGDRDTALDILAKMEARRTQKAAA